MISLAARDRIAAQGSAFVPNNGTVLTHGFSRVVANILLEAANAGKLFDVVILEGRPDAAGAKAAQFYARKGIPVRLCLDAAMGTLMESVDVVLTGAEAIAENGGVINKVGTYALACCATANNKVSATSVICLLGVDVSLVLTKFFVLFQWMFCYSPSILRLSPTNLLACILFDNQMYPPTMKIKEAFSFVMLCQNPAMLKPLLLLTMLFMSRIRLWTSLLPSLSRFFSQTWVC